MTKKAKYFRFQRADGWCESAVECCKPLTSESDARAFWSRVSRSRRVKDRRESGCSPERQFDCNLSGTASDKHPSQNFETGVFFTYTKKVVWC